MKKTSIVLFLGAGATAPLGKMLMNEFVNHLSEKSGFSKNSLFQDIIKKKPDLEFLLEELQDWGRKGYLNDRTASGNIVTSHAPINSGSTARLPNWFVRTATPLRKLVETEVYHSYKSFDSANEPRIVNHFKPLFELISKNLPIDEPIVVFTTNYDPAVELFCQQRSQEYELNSGFEFDPASGHSTWSRRAFENPTTPQPGRRRVILIKLHGSTDWLREGNRIVRSVSVYAGNDPNVKNVIIYPAQRKVAVDEPFFTAYYYLHELLSEARCFLSVGYSFRDLDALTRIMSARRRNPGLEIAVVAPDAEDIDKRELSPYGLTKVCKIPHKYGATAEQSETVLGLILEWFQRSLTGA